MKQRYVVAPPVEDGNQWWGVNDTLENESMASFSVKVLRASERAFELAEELNNEKGSK